ncbi:MAG: hypothetical protein GXO61_01405, partial [Epsilonproteobacteria bacterium]|nr:hypothetical protein [Campylobacterota bacterium]
MFDWLFGGKKEDNNNEKNEQVENNEGLDLEDLQLDISTDSTTESNSDEGIVLKEENNLDQGSLMVGGVEDLESTLELQNSQPQAEVIP